MDVSTHLAPTELGRWLCCVYKHLAPPELRRCVGCDVSRARGIGATAAWLETETQLTSNSTTAYVAVVKFSADLATEQANETYA